MEWLRIQLQFFRERGMKAIIMGHVPPARVDTKESWDETCWQKYTLWVRQFRDVIVGSLYGHMNIDHFMLQDFDHIKKDTENGRMANGASASIQNAEMSLLEDGEVTAASASDYLINLRQAWAQLPSPPAKSNKKSRQKAEDSSVWEWTVSKATGSKKGDKPSKGNRRDYLDKIGGKFAERYAATLVAPSVVPNYFPTLRIVEYNISGLESLQVSTTHAGPEAIIDESEQPPLHSDQFSDDDSYLNSVEDVIAQKKKHKGKKGKKGPRKYKFRVPEGPSKSAPPGPAYSPQSLTWTRYVQYFANLTHINNDFLDPQRHPLSDIDTSSNNQIPHTIFGLGVSSNGDLGNSRWKEGKHGKHQGKTPRPEPHPNNFTFEIEYDTEKDKGFKDLTVRRWVEYARKIGRSGAKAADAEHFEDFEDFEEDEDEDGEENDAEVEYVALDSDDDDDEDDDQNDHESDLSQSGKKHHRKGKHGKKKKKKHHRVSKEWLTFVKRAFVNTMNPHDIQELFGTVQTHSSEDEEDWVEVEVEDEEIMEL